MRRLGVRVPHGAPMKIVLRQKSYFYCKNIKSVGTRTQRSASPPSFACGYAVRFALRIACCSPGKKAKGLLHQRECPMDIRTAASPNMRSMCRRPDAQHTGKSLMARQIKNTHRKVSVFDLHAITLFSAFFRACGRGLFSRSLTPVPAISPARTRSAAASYRENIAALLSDAPCPPGL